MKWSTLIVVTVFLTLFSAEGLKAQEQMAKEPAHPESAIDETPMDEAPIDEAPIDEVAMDETAMAETAMDETPIDEAATDESAAAPDGAEGTTRKNSTHTLRLADGAASPAAKIGDVAWLTGYWRGPGLGGECEEIWSHPLDGRMFGTFVLAQEGKVAFSEAMVLVEEEESLVLKVKHFDPNFIGWEEKDGFVRFPLVHLEENVAYFSGLTLRRSGDSLTIHLVIHQKGKRGEVEFHFERVSF
ncbi:MAG: hypothetical protein K0U98_11895 [Deltaproteobacteria bacterium]|nr:hypothetical protein [Deltaproteobacteria bacterium]